MTGMVTVSLPFFLALALFAAIGVGYVCTVIIDLGPPPDADLEVERVVLLPGGWTRDDLIETIDEIEAL